MKKNFFLIWMGFLQSSFAFNECTHLSCDAVVDIGYTGIRVHVYAYNARSFRQDKNLHQIYSKKINRPLDETPPNEVNLVLDNLFSDFPKQVLNTYVYATEGMRSLPIRQEIQYARAIRQWFKQQKNLNLIELRKISGDEEASYAWISNDYYLNHPHYSNGIIEIGGGSAQVAVNVDSSHDDFHTIPFMSFNHELVRVWTASLHQFGREKMASRVDCHAPMDIHVCVEHLVKTSRALEPQTLENIQKFLQKKSFSVSWYGLGLLNHMGFSPYINSKNSSSYPVYGLIGNDQDNACKLPKMEAKLRDPFAQKACFNMAYAYTLTHELLGLDAATNIHYYHTSNGQGWPQGILIWRLLKG